MQANPSNPLNLFGSTAAGLYKYVAKTGISTRDDIWTESFVACWICVYVILGHVCSRKCAICYSRLSFIQYCHAYAKYWKSTDRRRLTIYYCTHIILLFKTFGLTLIYVSLNEITNTIFVIRPTTKNPATANCLLKKDNLSLVVRSH